MHRPSLSRRLALVGALVLPGALVAGAVGALVSFSDGQYADVAHVNANFTKLKTAVDDNHGRLTTVEGKFVGAIPFPTSAGNPLGTFAAGAVFFDTSSRQLKAFDGTTWKVIGGAPGGFVHDTTTGFSGSAGTFSNGNRTWATGSTAANQGVTLARTFAAGQDFELVTYWAASYRGLCMVYGPSMNHTTFSGGANVYCQDRATSGYAAGTWFGQYHAPIQGGGAATTGAWFRQARTGNSLQLQYSMTSATGPWTNVLAPVVIPAADKVVVVLGEAGATETAPLQLVSLQVK